MQLDPIEKYICSFQRQQYGNFIKYKASEFSDS